MKIRRALLVLPILASALISAAPSDGRDPLPVPDIPGYKTLKADFHLHTVFSDGEVWPVMRVSEAWRDGLDVIAITDHAGYNPHKGDVATDLTRPYAIAREAAERAGIILIPGVEIAEQNFHCNALFVKDPNAAFGLDLIPALRKMREQGAFIFWNHPGWRQEKAGWFPIIASAHDARLLDGVELVNGTEVYKQALAWRDEKNLAIFGNSDLHGAAGYQYEPRKRPITLLFVKSADAGGVRDALFAHRTAVWLDEDLWGAEQHLKGIWDGAVKVENPQLVFRPEMRSMALRLHNGSAVPFRLRFRNAPDWLRCGSAELRGESVTAVPITLTKAAPEGRQRVELELEIANLHTAPGRNLAVRVRLDIENEPK